MLRLCHYVVSFLLHMLFKKYFELFCSFLNERVRSNQWAVLGFGLTVFNMAAGSQTFSET